MGRQFFTQLKAACDALGLHYRFEVVLDTGREGLKLSPHFLRRVAKASVGKGGAESGCYGNGCHVGDSPGGDAGVHGNGCHDNSGHLTYRHLENVPCVVVMTGEERPHVCLPR